MLSENEFNRLTRWGIPGWIAILAFVTFTLTDIIFSKGQARLFDGINGFIENTNLISSAVAAFFVAAAGVPLGYVIYQSYFFFRWNSPFARDGLVPPFIVGRNEDLDRTIRDITKDELIQNELWREKWVKHPLYQRDHGWRWRYIELLFTEATQKIDTVYSGSSIFTRNRYLMDIMHTLGASLVGIYFGQLSYLMLKVYRENIFFPLHAFAIIAPLTILIYLLDKEDMAKQYLEKNGDMQTSVENRDPVTIFEFKKWIVTGPRAYNSVVYPGSIFLVLLAFIHLFCNPLLISTSLPMWDLLLKVGIASVAIAAWMRSKKRSPENVSRGELTLLLLSLLISIAINQLFRQLLSGLDWPYLTSVFVFLVANLVLLKNRQNARDDLIALEYYTLRRYITEKQHLDKISEYSTYMK